MAPCAIFPRPEGKGDLAVASAAPLSLEYLFHRDRVGPGFGDEYLRMADVTAEPICVDGMREKDVRHERHFGLDKYIEV